MSHLTWHGRFYQNPGNMLPGLQHQSFGALICSCLLIINGASVGRTIVYNFISLGLKDDDFTSQSVPGFPLPFHDKGSEASQNYDPRLVEEWSTGTRAAVFRLNHFSFVQDFLKQCVLLKNNKLRVRFMSTRTSRVGPSRYNIAGEFGINQFQRGGQAHYNTTTIVVA